MLNAKFQGHRSFVLKKTFFKGFPYNYWCGSHIGHMTQILYIEQLVHLEDRKILQHNYPIRFINCQLSPPEVMFIF